MNAPVIKAEQPDAPEAVSLIGELDAYLGGLYPLASQHGLSVEALCDPAITFLVAYLAGQAVGCGGILIASEYAELKRLYVRPQWRGLGIAQALLQELESIALTNGRHVIRLEAGVHQPEACRLYERAGYRPTSVFGPYHQVDTSLSLFYEKQFG